MMDRTRFTDEFRRRLRFVLQKAERADEARTQARALGRNPLFDPREHTAVTEAENNLDAAIDQLADHVMDLIELSLEP